MQSPWRCGGGGSIREQNKREEKKIGYKRGEEFHLTV
jgi:hypothetical protein